MRVLFTIIMFLISLSLQMAGQEYTVMFYNVENLFDTEDDTTKNDNEFLPEGERRWTATRYYRKLNAIARAAAAAGEWDLPSLIGLCEVENERVVKDLAYGTLLSAGNYGIVHRESPDPRGIDLALLYRRDRFAVSEVRDWLPESEDSVPVTTRNLLYVKVTARGDPLHILLCHLPSRRGGVLAAGGLRERMLQLAACKVDSIMSSEVGRAAVIVMGDFNTSPEEPLMLKLTGSPGCSLPAPGDGANGRGAGLVNLSAGLAKKGTGSYRYQGSWEMIDQVIVSPVMTDSTGHWHADPESFRVVDTDFLFTDDGTYPGRKPFPTYGGYRYSGGYSDHLPVAVKLIHR